MSSSYRVDIEKTTVTNRNYRKVLYTTKDDLQLTVMALKPGQDIGMEVHHNLAQFVRVESGTGRAIVGKSKYRLKDGVAIVIPRGIPHNIVNTSRTDDLKFYVLYTAREHPTGLVEKTKKKG